MIVRRTTPVIAMPAGGLPAPRVALTDSPPHLEGPAIMHAWRKASDDLERIYPKLGQGLSREVFDGGDVVYKIGTTQEQERELAAYTDPQGYGCLPVAPCRIVHHSSGIAILIMECVRPAVWGEPLPTWALQIDGQQVGWRAGTGELMIFDANLACSEPLTREQDVYGLLDGPVMSGREHKLPARFARMGA